MVKLYDLSQPLNQEAPFWPLYPPFEVKFIKRKAEHGVNAQYIMTSNHMGTHLDAPLHFVTGGKSIDQIPLTQLYGPGVIVDVDIDYYTRPIKLSQWYLVYGFASCNKVKRRIKMGSHMV